MNSTDDGCYVHPVCLTCPLPECIYDHPAPRGKPRDLVREATVHQLAATGMRHRAIAREAGINPHTVADILRRTPVAIAR